MAESKPFRLKSQDPENKGPDGYRDALIWLSIAESASTMTDRDLLVFVTSNHKDFCDEGQEDPSVSAHSTDSPTRAISLRAWTYTTATGTTT
jgi:hypothetical protein